LTLTRFFAMHAGILPAMLVGFLALHIMSFAVTGSYSTRPQTCPRCSVLAGSGS
jgi:quinol-cytochrome oxidoreductase complex cytochrome b subunit